MDKISPNNIEYNPEAWVDLHADFLYQYALPRVANNTQAAEDLVQETFLSALKSISKFVGNSSIRTWFVSILKNKIIDYYRKKKNNIVEQTDFFNPEFVEEGASKGHWKEEFAPLEWDNNPDNIFEKQEFYVVLNNCLGELPDNLSSVFILKELENLESENICKEMSITASNLWVKLHRARIQLRRCLEINWFSSNK